MLRHYVDPSKFRTETAISEATLDQCMTEQAGLRAYYGAEAAHAEAQAARTKATFELLEAQLYDKHRRILATSGEKTTEKMIENAVRLDPAWIHGKNRLIEAETISNVNRALVFSLVDRKDMLTQLGNDRRGERAGQLRILEREERDANLGDRARTAAKTALER